MAEFKKVCSRFFVLRYLFRTTARSLMRAGLMRSHLRRTRTWTSPTTASRRVLFRTTLFRGSIQKLSVCYSLLDFETNLNASAVAPITSNLYFQILLYFNFYYSLIYFFIMLSLLFFKVRVLRLSHRTSLLHSSGSSKSISQRESHCSSSSCRFQWR